MIGQMISAFGADDVAGNRPKFRKLRFQMIADILDASVAISWCFPGDPTEDSPYSWRVLKELVANDAVVPEIWAFEVANSIFVSFSRRRRISEPQIAEYLGLLKALPIRVEPQHFWSNVDLESLAPPEPRSL